MSCIGPKEESFQTNKDQGKIKLLLRCQEDDDASKMRSVCMLIAAKVEQASLLYVT
jgi:hypothetical protein